MQTSSIKLISFSVNNWTHLYSLEQAVRRTRNATGGQISIHGEIRNCPLLNNQDTTIDITFNKVSSQPDYQQNGDYIVLGDISRHENSISAILPVDEQVFKELRNNLMEYCDIDGIHIIVTLGIIHDHNNWPVNRTLQLVKLNYAMKGDA